jgi:hypothetical protein
MNPEEAVRAYTDLGEHGTMIGMHWGTWRLTDEDPLEPPRALDVGRRGLTVALVFLAPLFALLLARSFRGEGRFYVDHLVVSLHAHSVLFVLGVVAVLASAALRVDVAGGAGVAALGVWILHLIAALRRVYGRPWPTTFLRTLSVLGVYLLILLVVLGIAAGLIVAAREAAG